VLAQITKRDQRVFVAGDLCAPLNLGDGLRQCGLAPGGLSSAARNPERGAGGDESSLRPPVERARPKRCGFSRVFA